MVSMPLAVASIVLERPLLFSESAVHSCSCNGQNLLPPSAARGRRSKPSIARENFNDIIVVNTHLVSRPARAGFALGSSLAKQGTASLRNSSFQSVLHRVHEGEKSMTCYTFEETRLSQ